MGETLENNKIYEKLTPQRKRLIDEVKKNLNKGDGLWKKGWVSSGTPESALTGKKYHGINNFYLSMAAIGNGYSDNRWATYRQIQDKGWKFKRNEEGKSLGKDAGVPIEFFELRDRETKQPFDRRILDGMSDDEREEYIKDNVYALRKYYVVFNGDVIDGIPELKKREIDPTGYSQRAEALIKLWSDKESRIYYGGGEAYYHRGTDRIHLPKREDFLSLQEFYSTALHEIGHSTGHEKRLNRDMGDGFGTSSYAEEELRAEIASMFIEQDLGIEVGEKHIENNSAYIKSWNEIITENPNVLFEAIASAERISQFVMAKEQQKEIEPYAVEETIDEYGNRIYRLHMTSEQGQEGQALNLAYHSREELIAEVGKMQDLPLYADKELKEVSMEELQNISEVNIEGKDKKTVRRTDIEEDKSDIFIRPSEIAARAAAVVTVAAVTTDMTGRGIESLTHLSDRDIIERAKATKSGEKFDKLYNGGSLLGNEEKDERSLLARLAMFTGNDEEQLLRIFRSSGQYREGKTNEYYEKLAKEEIQFVSRLMNRGEAVPKIAHESSKGGRYGINAKS